MMAWNETLVALAALVASAALVGVVRRIALAHGVMDHPTSRGSHAASTPRGGGLGAIIVILVSFAMLAAQRGDMALLACVTACAAVAVVGWEDDKRGLPVRTRLIVHVSAALTVGVLSLRGAGAPAVAAVVFAWWAFWTVSSINLVNFMDGINGLVASQVAIFAASLMFCDWQSGAASWYAAITAAACLGFLPWNFPRARIFLGDVGSGALGFLVPVLALVTMQGGHLDLIRAHLPLVPLFGDATVTILRRWRRGDRLSVPHRTHLYQRMANGPFGHTQVTLVYALASITGALVAHVPPDWAGWWPVVAYAACICAVAAGFERSLKRSS